MEHEELVKLAGEQALLRKEYTDLSAAFNRDKQALLNLYNDMPDAAKRLGLMAALRFFSACTARKTNFLTCRGGLMSTASSLVVRVKLG